MKGPAWETLLKISYSVYINNSAAVSGTKSVGRLTLFAACVNVSQKKALVRVIFPGIGHFIWQS